MFLSSLILIPLGLTLAQDHGHGHTLNADGKRAGHTVETGLVSKASHWVGKTAPGFDTVDSTGKKVSLAKLLKKPVVLVFIEKNCPCCKGGKPYFDRIQRKYGDVANVVGIVVGPQKVAATWKSGNGAEFLVLSDAKHEILAKYGVTSSLFTALINRDGKIVKAYPGYSQPMLTELTATVAKLAGIKNRNMEVRPAPMEFTSGCPFMD